jgi:hypothetical protein
MSFISLKPSLTLEDMKVLCCCLILFLSCVVASAQFSNTPQNDKQLKFDCLQAKGSKQMRTGLILLTAGYTSATLGILSAVNYGYFMDDWPTASIVLFIAGNAAATTGWYFFISGALKKKKAKTQLKLLNQTFRLIEEITFLSPSIAITFRL